MRTFLQERPRLRESLRAHPACANLDDETHSVLMHHLEDRCLEALRSVLECDGWSVGQTVNDSIFVERGARGRDGLHSVIERAEKKIYNDLKIRTVVRVEF